jgi:predicted RNA-binding Zn ribbon-like protein
LLFAHDTEVALAAAADLVNTARQSTGDTLTTVAELDEFIGKWEYTGVRRRDARELEAVRALRPVLAQLWDVDEDAAVAILNRLLAEANALPHLVKHDAWDYHLHATRPDAPLADRLAVEAAMAFVDVVRTKELARLRVCAAEDCRDVYVDLSKNRSRRFCDASCANRTNVSAYRARKAGAD